MRAFNDAPKMIVDSCGQEDTENRCCQLAIKRAVVQLRKDDSNGFVTFRSIESRRRDNGGIEWSRVPRLKRMPEGVHVLLARFAR